MLNESELNKRFMPLVSRAKARGGPSVLQAVGPALLTKNWQKNSMAIRDLLISRFGVKLATCAANGEAKQFAVNNEDVQLIVITRYKAIYEQTATTA